MSVNERLVDNGYEGVKYLTDFDYESALIGVTHDNRAVYDFNKMIEYLINTEGFENETEAIERIEYNTIRALPYMGNDGPIVLYSLME